LTNPLPPTYPIAELPVEAYAQKLLLLACNKPKPSIQSHPRWPRRRSVPHQPALLRTTRLKTAVSKPAPNHSPPTAPPNLPRKKLHFTCLTRYACLPVPLCLLAIFGLYVLPLDIAYESPHLLLVLNILFLTAGSIFVAYLAGRAFLLTAALTVLLLGCAALPLGLATIIGAANHHASINASVTVYTLGLWLAALGHLTAAVVALVPQKAQPPKAPAIALTAAYALVLALIMLITFAAFDGHLPAFFLPQQGPSLLRQIALGSAVAMFFCAALFLRAVHTRTACRFARWYALALALTASGLIAIMLQQHPGCPLAWIGRLALYLGTTYLLVAVLSTLRQAGLTGLNLQAALRRTEQRYQRFFDDDLTGDFFAKPDGAITECNPAFAKIYGLQNPRQATQANIAHFNPNAWKDLVQRLKKEKIVYAYQTTHRRPDGRKIGILTNVVGEFNDQGQLTQIKGYLFENTETQLAQERIHDVALFPEENPFPVLRVTADGRLLYANRAAASLLDQWQCPIGHKVPPDVQKLVTSALHTGQLCQWETSCQGRLLSLSLTPIAQRQYVNFYALDITERQQADDALRSERDFIDRVLATAGALVVVLDTHGRIIRFNRACEQLTGYQFQQVENRVFWEFLLIPEEIEPVKQVFKDLRDGQFPSEYENFWLTSTGQRRLIHWTNTDLTDADGNVQCVIATGIDITERKKAEDALRQSHDLLEQRVTQRTAELSQSNRELDRRSRQLARLASELTLAEQRERRRLATLLHDHLQQLLVGAKFGLEVLAKRAQQEHQYDVNQVANLIDESIKVSRSLSVELSPPILHAAGLAAGLEWLVRWMSEKHGLDVDLQLDPHAHTDREDLRILLFQAARELLFNVVKHAGVTSAAIRLQCLDTEHLQLTVADEGRGFDPDAIWQAVRELTGGFGLFGIRERVALLRGQLHIDSAPQQGARITLTAPIHKGDSAALGQPASPTVLGPLPGHAISDTLTMDAPANIPEPQVAPSESDRPIIRILLVDDHTVMRHGLSLLLADEDDVDVVGEAADGLQAIEQARKLQPDVILMDFSMPRMDGTEATRTIHHEMPHIRIIGLSMYEQADRAAAMLEAGAVAYLSKTEDPEQLLKEIRNIH